MRYLGVTCVAALFLAACGNGGDKRERPAPLVEAKPVGQATFSDAVDAVGTALANEQVILSAPVTERITAIHFTDGGFVPRGAIIATLAQAQERAELAAAQARVQESGLQLTRVKALKDRGFATNASVENQIAVADEARATAQQANATIGDRIIRAPFAGYASLRTVSAGAVVTAGTPIATISDISRIKLDFTVPETQLTSIREGQSIVAMASAFGDKPFRGTIATIDPVIDPTSRAVRVRAILPNPDKALKPGMLMTVRILSRERTAMAVPELSLVGDGEDRYVFVVNDDRKAKRVKVVTGTHQNGVVEIISGISPGQRIVTEGVVKLSDGLPFRLAEDTPPAAKGAAPAASGH
ncbi:efflux RND transporter periplasmic adaptor subunit [Sphingobium phenoxybenzoativorans]|uniref:Efflux RND transporter periplasmic adaptor subunit n=1 Tax=Sphingobium phenoxybenzoativorans TaxID=1592790 RepID=A0A975Q0E4_9SPHN|nr:efflux RND transporter periplasmic adaptor subunit [Sphingobium phenoxybenzoativorans]QUT04659.1 efflux RND transporter periplasmic adaptor subunit [Sphingobium phenoxybenzoativorans]